MSERLHAGESFSSNLVKEIFAETARARTTVPSPRDAFDIQRIYEVLAPHVPSLLKLHGTDCYSEIFRLIFEHGWKLNGRFGGCRTSASGTEPTDEVHAS
ncbi:hypothetical protein QTH90_21410 [Variovorax sp. J2P1-59]|uniref:hypothetical protein n=1 Tax=Variovorax flavidus TaxID=3053501 RepID=UPI0025773072|nr:hypothetical protein [Variovorax sp. J2P1-59]MDM0076982.1 hypothetical protein [Variovorax sp. J2P1-59]